MTIGFISSAFISLQSVPRLMVGAFSLFRVACRQLVWQEERSEKGRIGGTGEALATAATPRRQRLSSASWRLRAQRYGLHCRQRVWVKMVDERRNGTRKRQDRAMTGKDPVILRKNRRPGRRPLVAAPPGDVIDHGLPFYGIENVDLHKADTDPPSRWHRECHSKGWKVV